MAVFVTHSTVATLPDEPGAEVNKAQWNANHTLVGLGSAAEAATTDFDAAGAATAAVAVHEAAFDPHPQYLDKMDGDGLYVAADINLRCAITKIADIATARILGRVTAGTSFVEVLTGTQATTLLDTFTSLLKGLVPASGGGTVNFLRADGTFAAPTAVAADPSYSPSSFTVATETGRARPVHTKLNGSQRITLQGTARLSLQN